MISLEEFLELSSEEIAKLVRESGSKVVVFPINGTRRWFMLEYGDEEFEDPIAAYMDIAMERHIELYKLFFDHGVDTLLTPVIGQEILETRDAYMQNIGAEGLARLATHPKLLSFYEKKDVRVFFYGEYKKYLSGTGYNHLIELFDQITENTKQNKKHRLFFGAFADQMRATKTIAEFSVQYHTQYGHVPTRKEIIEMYYGAYLEKANIFIGFDRFAVFDYPMLNWGEEDLYFMVAPSTYLTSYQLKTILYDHLYSRRIKEVDYITQSPKDLNRVRAFYKENSSKTIGIGRLLDGTWVPDNI